MDSLRLLVLHDVDIHSSSMLAEKYVPLTPEYDAVLAIGPFYHAPLNSENKLEDYAVAEGDIASCIAQLENIVCRVIYLPGENDPPAALCHQLHLTPNSVNIYARKMKLVDNLLVYGFTEKSEDLLGSSLPDDVDRSPDSDDELDGVQVKSSSATSIEIIKDLLCSTSSDVTPTTESNGIFMFDYKFTHTLSHFLFHMVEGLEGAGVNLCVIPPNGEDSKRLPKKLGNLHILVPPSLRVDGGYCTVEMARDGAKWAVQSITHQLIDNGH